MIRPGSNSRALFESSTRAAAAARVLLLTLFYAGLTAAVTFPQARVLDRAIPNMIDGYFNIWRLAWIAHQLPRHPFDLFQANIFYPERYTLAFSDALLAPGIVAAPLFWLRGNPVLIYNIVFLSGFALSGMATYLLVADLTANRIAALIAGAFFVCAPYRFDHWVHLEMQLTMFMPVALWALHLTIRTQRWRWALVLAAAFALQVFCCIYYGIFLIPILFVVAALLIALQSRQQFGRALMLLAGAGAVGAVLVLPYMVPYLEARRAVGERPQEAVLYYSAIPKDYLASRPDNWLYGGRLTGTNHEERHLFPGLALLVCVAAALWPPVSRTVALYAAACATAFEASLGLRGYVFHWLRAWVLPFQGIRVPARFGMLVALLLAVLAGCGIARVARLMPLRGQIALAAALVIAMILEARTPVLLTTVMTTPSPVDIWLRHQRRSVIVELPLPPPNAPFQESEGQPLYHSIFHWQPILNGTSGFFPASYLELLSRMESFPSGQSIQYLKTRDVRYVVMREYMFESDAFVRLRDHLAQEPALDLVGRFPEGNGESLVFETRKGGD
jgi:hypothetical protein